MWWKWKTAAAMQREMVQNAEPENQQRRVERRRNKRNIWAA